MANYRFKCFTRPEINSCSYISDMPGVKVSAEFAPVINKFLDVIEENKLSVSQAQRILEVTKEVLPSISFLGNGHT